MKGLYQCAKIAQSLQHNIRPLLDLGLLCFYSKVFPVSFNKKLDNKLHLLR